MKKISISIGQKVNMLTILEELESKDYGYRKSRMVSCKCECGMIKNFLLREVLNGRTKSCGCYKKMNSGNVHRTHGLSSSSEYKTWQHIQGRCYNKNTRSYPDYGGRGIICKWTRFEDFYEDMGKRPSDEYSIDRIDPNGNYSKENCKWSTDEEQSKRKRSTIYVLNEGVEICLKDFCKINNFSYRYFSRMIKQGNQIKNFNYSKTGQIVVPV